MSDVDKAMAQAAHPGAGLITERRGAEAEHHERLLHRDCVTCSGDRHQNCPAPTTDGYCCCGIIRVEAHHLLGS